MNPVLDKLFEIRGNMNFTESLALKVVSLLLALILWITILGFKREEINRSVKFEPMFPPGKVLLTPIPTQIHLTIVGPRVLLKDEEKRLHPLRPDLRHRQENTIALPISEELLDELPPGVKVTSIQPKDVLIHLDDVVEKQIAVRPNFLGALPAGWEIAAVVVSPRTVSVTGPKTRLESMAAISTEPIPLQDMTESTTREVAVEADFSQNLQLSREKIVSVRITLRKIRK